MKKAIYELDGFLGENGLATSADELALIDRAVAASKEAAHACHNQAAREHFEFALALLQESWIAESGQEARSAEKVIADVRWGLRLIAAVFAKEEKQ